MNRAVVCVLVISCFYAYTSAQGLTGPALGGPSVAAGSAGAGGLDAMLNAVMNPSPVAESGSVAPPPNPLASLLPILLYFLFRSGGFGGDGFYRILMLLLPLFLGPNSPLGAIFGGSGGMGGMMGMAPMMLMSQMGA